MSETQRRSGAEVAPGKTITWPLGVGLGAALGYFLDPESGKRRRHLLQDKVTHVSRRGLSGTRKAVADVENRFKGVVAEVRARSGHGEPADDEVLLQRVRSRLGHAVSHPRAIEVKVDGGRVTLSGPVLDAEASGLLREVWATTGVLEVKDELERFESAADVPALQGGRERKGHHVIGAQWTPAYRLFGVAASLPLLGFGLKHRGASGGLATGLGASLLARSITNLPLGKLTGFVDGADVIDVRKHLHVDAPREQVSTQLQNPETVRELFSQVSSLERRINGRGWDLVLQGPAGLPLPCTVEITEYVPNERASFRTLEGSRFQLEGHLHLSATDQGGTEIDLQFCYNPPGGVLGDALATLLGAGTRQCLHDDLPRIQRLLERQPETDAQQQAAAKPIEGQGQVAMQRGEEEEHTGSSVEGESLKTGGDPRFSPESGDRGFPQA